MKFNRHSLRPLATIAAGLLALVACQNATDSNSNSDTPVVATGQFPIAAPRIPDSAAWIFQKDTVAKNPTCPTSGQDSAITCTETFDLPHSLGKDSVALQLWTLGVQTYTVYFKESGSPTTLSFATASVVSLDTLLLSKFADLSAGQRTSFGNGPSGLVAYYASLILSNDPAVVGKALPVGMSLDSVEKQIVRVGVDSGKTLSQLTSLNIHVGSTTLALDSTTIRLDISVLIQAKLIPASDSAALFPPYPVQVSTPVAVAGNLTAGGSAVGVTGAFSWTTGHNFKPTIRIRTVVPGDSANIETPTERYFPTDTTWNLNGNLSLLATASASAGTDTLFITLSDDSGHSATSSATFTVTAASALAAPGFTPAGGSYAIAQSVSLTTSSTGAQIYYTTDGTAPTTASTKYADTAISVPVGETIQAIAVEAGHPTSAVGSATYTIGVAGSPAFSPAAGTYSTAQNVSLTSATTGATIYYTTDGSAPTPASTKYTGAAVPVVASETIQAIAVAVGMATSPAASAAYAIGSTGAPTFTPAAGTFSSAQNVVLSSASAGATIYYTTDGSTPTSASTKYNDTALAVVGSETIKAIAIANGFTSSTTTSVYAISIPGQTASPTFTPAPGTYSSAQNVALSCATSGATIYYTVDGTPPTTSSSVYGAPISVAASETVKALAVASGSTNSQVASAAYTIQLPAAAPTFSPAGATYTSSQNVTLASTTSGAVIYYTLDGSTPTTSSSVYSTPIGVGASQTIKAIAVATNVGTSSVSSAVYTINVPGVTASPTFSPVAGTYTASQSVTLASATTGATIYYTLDGTPPTTSSSVYSSPIGVGANETIKAMAMATGSSASAVTTAAYVISIPGVTATPTFTPAAGTYTAAQSVTLASTTAGATIYYTLDGSPPSTASSVYSTPLAVGASETIKAFAVAAGSTNSTVGTAAYIIQLPAATPTFSPAAGNVTVGQSVTLGCTTPSASIYYTTDGSPPTTSSALYTSPIPVGASETIKAIAVASGSSVSALASAAYVLLPPAATPTFTPVAGTYTSAQSVSLSSTTSGAKIYYTTNGSAPTTASTLYASPIAVSTSDTIKAIAVATGYSNSTVANAAYSIQPPAATPTFTPAAGTYTSAQSVSLSSTTSGA
ncbi:MAG TPA: chitobiase/beta-hexosaminidase C-terminal domain-containing protein, partial [Fibrobacteria bacterium]|nr:chitobiase/beta-hexosaminidase C-terminal domain-containing protein [Fibrobacteria bacterium]